MIEDVFLGRQAIFSPSNQTVAYEILYRHRALSHAVVGDPDAASAATILRALGDFGLDDLCGDLPAFVNITRAFIVGQYPIQLPPERVVLEVLEDVRPDAEVIAGLRRLRAAGYRIAIDDYAGDSALQPLLDLAQVVKIDCLAMSPRDVELEVARLRRPGLQLLAEKIETHDEFERLRALGFDLYQGFHLHRPQLLQGRRIRPHHLALLRLLARLQDPQAGFDEVAAIVAQDVGLSFQILRHVSSARYALVRPLTSVHEAVVYLGWRNVRNLACLFVLAGARDKPGALILGAMFRAKMCELLAQAAHRPDPAGHFTLGMLSLIDAIIDRAMEEIVAELRLSAPLVAALLRREGELAPLLVCVEDYERCRWERVGVAGLSPSEIRDCYVAAVRWSQDLYRDAMAAAA